MIEEKTKVPNRGDVLARVRGIGRREGPHKDQALLLAKMIKSGRPAAEIQRQLKVMSE